MKKQALSLLSYEQRSTWTPEADFKRTSRNEEKNHFFDFTSEIMNTTQQRAKFPGVNYTLYPGRRFAFISNAFETAPLMKSTPTGDLHPCVYVVKKMPLGRFCGGGGTTKTGESSIHSPHGHSVAMRCYSAASRQSFLDNRCMENDGISPKTVDLLCIIMCTLLPNDLPAQILTL